MSAQPLSLRFTGNGSEYFRIWIVNLLLSIVTLGIYSPWAKVRRNQYFYRHTLLADSGFDYHGDPKSILKGRVIAVLLFGSYSFSSRFDPTIAAVIFLAILAVLPWLLVRSLRFRLHNTSYRGLRFGFHGQTGPAYWYLLGAPFLGGATLGLLWPWAQQRMMVYTRDHSSFGSAHFKFEATVGAFYKIYFWVFLLAVLMFAGAAAATTLVLSSGAFPLEGQNQAGVIGGVAALLTYFGLLVIVYPFVSARMQNLVWGHTRLGPHRFTARARARDLLWIMISNVLLIGLSLGLFKPFADIRLARYRLECTSLLPGGSLADFVAGLQSQAGAAGEEIADIFDFDIAL